MFQWVFQTLIPTPFRCCWVWPLRFVSDSDRVSDCAFASSVASADLLSSWFEAWFLVKSNSPVESQFYGMKLLKDYSSADLRRIISIKEQIEALQTELEAFSGETGDSAVGEPIKRGRRRMSASARRKIGLAQKARWAKVKGIEVASEAR